MRIAALKFAHSPKYPLEREFTCPNLSESNRMLKDFLDMANFSKNLKFGGFYVPFRSQKMRYFALNIAYIKGHILDPFSVSKCCCAIPEKTPHDLVKKDPLKLGRETVIFCSKLKMRISAPNYANNENLHPQILLNPTKMNDQILFANPNF